MERWQRDESRSDSIGWQRSPCEKQEHEKFRSQIAELKTKLGGEAATESLFARLRESLDGFQASFFD